MRFPPEPPPFTKRQTVIGSFIAGERSTPPLDCLIDISPTGSHPILGWILGNKETVDQIEKTWGRHEAMRFEGSTGHETVVIDEVWIRSTGSFGGPTETMPAGLMGVICKFEAPSVTFRFSLGEDGSREQTKWSREVRFFLVGPRQQWGWWGSRMRSFTGESTPATPFRVAIGGRLPFVVFVVPHYFHSRDSVGFDREPVFERASALPRDVSSETTVMALFCRTYKNPTEYSDDLFFREARSAAEDLCLIVSLLSDAMVSWHGYFHSSPGLFLEHYRSMSVERFREVGHDSEIVEPGGRRDFLRIAFRRLRRLRSEGINLEVPILYTVAAARARVMRQKFGELFLALEALRSLYLESKERTFLVSSNVFRDVKSDIREMLPGVLRRRGIRSRRIANEMIAKLPELRRPPFWVGLNALFAHLRVPWQDLYPDPVPEIPTFVGLRNTLFHSHEQHDNEKIVKETLRLDAVVKRVLLRWLGWEDLWQVPPPWERAFIAGKSLPEGKVVRDIHGRPRKRSQSRERRKKRRRPTTG